MNRICSSLVFFFLPWTLNADPTSDLLMRQSSGTSMNPQAAPHQMWMTMQSDWTVMIHGSAFVNQVLQTGPRGDDKLFSTNWIMGMAQRPLGGGQLMFRSMLSLEPATITNRSYPMLFQTGETAYGQPLRDGQHPHDFFMELAAEYARPLGDDTIGYVYAALMGDPSLGPVAFPHRASAAELPQATLGHHLQDSTHIAANVITVGVQSGIFGGAVSAFHGKEPDEHRWDIEAGAIDSWALRVTLDPTPNWSMQVSTGHLTDPEEHESTDIERTTASLAYSRPWSGGSWSSNLIFGHNNPDGHREPTSSWLAEGVVQFAQKNHVTARAEIVDRDELVEDEIFRVKALTLGYTRDVWSNSLVVGGVGGNVTIYDVPSALQPLYGSNPRAAYLFVRFRNAAQSGGHAMHH